MQPTLWKATSCNWAPRRSLRSCTWYAVKATPGTMTGAAEGGERGFARRLSSAAMRHEAFVKAKRGRKGYGAAG